MARPKSIKAILQRVIARLEAEAEDPKTTARRRASINRQIIAAAAQLAALEREKQQSAKCAGPSLGEAEPSKPNKQPTPLPREFRAWKEQQTLPDGPPEPSGATTVPADSSGQRIAHARQQQRAGGGSFAPACDDRPANFG